MGTPDAGRYLSPLRYPGGKARMADWLIDALDAAWSPMTLEVWLEPFGGGAGAGLTALHRGAVESLWVVEANPAMAAFWSRVADDGEDFAREVGTLEPSLEDFYAARSLVAEATADRDALATAAFIVNRCSRSGMVNPAVGPIGGRSQTRYRVTDRFNGPELAARIRRIAGFGDRLQVFAGDGISFLEQLPDSGVGDEVFSFVDPPYVDAGNRLYASGMGLSEHVRLSMALRALPSPWVCTYDSVPVIQELFPDVPVAEFAMHHATQPSRRGTEYLVSPILEYLPPFNPTGV